MKILLKKITVVSLLLFNLFLVESCQEKDTIKPAQTDRSEVSVVQRITDLGFDADEIKDMGTHYLVDGDVYFSKNNADEEKTGSEPARFDGKYPEFTVRMDNEIAGNETWKASVDYAIAAWNADKRQHMRLVLTTSTDAHITIRAGNGELTKEVPIVSEFAERGRLGSTIRVNMQYTGSINTEETKEKMLKALFRTTGCHKPKITSSSTASRTSPESPRQARSTEKFNVQNYLYIIRNDQLVRMVKGGGRTSDIEVLSEGWQGSTHMVVGRDNYLYVIQYGVLWWADPNSDQWGALSDGWTDAQALARYYTYDYLLIIDKNRDLYIANNNNSGKLKFYDLGSGGTFRMVALNDGIAISDFDKNTLLLYSFKTGKITTLVKSTAKVEEESEPIKWKNVIAMVRKYRSGSNGDVLWIPMKGTPRRLLSYYVGGNTIRNIEDGIDWTGVATVAYSMDAQYWQYLYYFQDGHLYEWEMNLPGIAQRQCSDCNWQGAFLIACTY